MNLFNDEIAARIAARMLNEHGINEEIEELYPLSVRLPASTKAMVDEMAENAGVSRNSMAIELIQAGIQSVLARLPDPIAQELREGAGERM